MAEPDYRVTDGYIVPLEDLLDATEWTRINIGPSAKPCSSFSGTGYNLKGELSLAYIRVLKASQPAEGIASGGSGAPTPIRGPSTVNEDGDTVQGELLNRIPTINDLLAAYPPAAAPTRATKEADLATIASLFGVVWAGVLPTALDTVVLIWNRPITVLDPGSVTSDSQLEQQSGETAGEFALRQINSENRPIQGKQYELTDGPTYSIALVDFSESDADYSKRLTAWLENNKSVISVTSTGRVMTVRLSNAVGVDGSSSVTLTIGRGAVSTTLQCVEGIRITAKDSDQQLFGADYSDGFTADPGAGGAVNDNVPVVDVLLINKQIVLAAIPCVFQFELLPAKRNDKQLLCWAANNLMHGHPRIGVSFGYHPSNIVDAEQLTKIGDGAASAVDMKDQFVVFQEDAATDTAYLNDDTSAPRIASSASAFKVPSTVKETVSKAAIGQSKKATSADNQLGSALDESGELQGDEDEELTLGGGGGATVTVQVYGGNCSPFEGKVKHVTRNGVQVVSDEDCKYDQSRSYIFPVDRRAFPTGAPAPALWEVGGVDLARLPNTWTHTSAFPTTGTDSKRLPDGLGWVRLPAGSTLPRKLYDYPDFGGLVNVAAGSLTILGAYARVGETNTVYLILSQPFVSGSTVLTSLTAGGQQPSVVTSVYGCVARLTVAVGTITGVSSIAVSALAGAFTAVADYGGGTSAVFSGNAALQSKGDNTYGQYVGDADDTARLLRGSSATGVPAVLAATWTPDTANQVKIYWSMTVEDLGTPVVAGKYVVHSNSVGLLVSGAAHANNCTTLTLSGNISTTSESVWLSIPAGAVRRVGGVDADTNVASKQNAYITKAVLSYVPVLHDFTIGAELILRHGDLVDISADETLTIAELTAPNTLRTFYKIIGVRQVGRSPVPVSVLGGNVPNTYPNIVGVADAIQYVSSRPAPSDWSLLYLSDTPTTGDFVGSATPPGGLGVVIAVGDSIFITSSIHRRDRCMWVTNNTLLRSVFASDTGQVVSPVFAYDEQTPANRVVTWSLL